MRCAKIRKLLEPYLDGECSQKQCQLVRKHLQGCPACRTELGRLQKVHGLLEGLETRQPDETYWQTFLPRLRAQIDAQGRQVSPGKIRQAWDRFFVPPVPWVRLAGAVAVAVLVLVVGRAIVRHESRMGPVRSLPKQLLTDQTDQAERARESWSARPETEQAPATMEGRTIPSEEIATPSKEHIFSTADELEGTSEALPDVQKTLRPKKETDITAVPLPAAPSTGEGRPVSEQNALVSAYRADREADLSSATGIPQEEGVLGEMQTRARALGPDQWRSRIEYWQGIVDSPTDDDALPEAYHSLSESRFRLAVLTAQKEDLLAALDAQRAALDFAAEDSIRQLLQGRIQTLEDLLQKK